MAETSIEEWVALASIWLAFVMSFLSLFFFGYQMKLKQCGWEVVYVAILEAITYLMIVLWGENAPFTWKLKVDGGIIEVAFVRYAEWLITCPVILIALSNLTGLKDDYNMRTMTLMSADQGTILCGATAAMCVGWARSIFFFFGAVYGVVTFYTCMQVYIESYANVPPVCKKTVATLAYMFMFSWGSFPALFLMGPEGFDHINIHWSTILHSIADLFAKNLWGLYAWYLRIQVREYHRKMWFEEQERLKKGEDEFEVDNERRPEVSMAAAATVLSARQGADEEEEDPDPYYAEYRRRRRRNRGRSLSEPDGPGDMRSKPAEAEPDSILQAPRMSMSNSVSNPIMMANSNMPQHQMGMRGQQINTMGMASSPIASSPMSPMGPNNPMPNPMGPIIVIVADNQGFQNANFFVSKLQNEMGAQVFPVNNTNELIQKCEMAKSTATTISAIFVLDGFLQQSDAFNMQNNYKCPFVQYGPNPQPGAMFGEAYLQVPQPGQSYTTSELIMLLNKLRTQQLGAPIGQMGGSPMNFGYDPMQQPGMTGMGGMGTPTAPSPATDAGTSVDILMAEMNALKQYLNTSGPN